MNLTKKTLYPFLPVFAAAVLLAGCHDIRSRMDPVTLLADGSSDAIPVGAIRIWGSEGCVVNLDGGIWADYIATDSTFVDGRGAHTYLAPLDGGLRWVPGSDASLFFAAAPALDHAGGPDGLFGGFSVPALQSPLAPYRGAWTASPAVAKRGDAAHLVLHRAWTRLTVDLNVASLGGAVPDSLRLLSAMSSLCGPWSVDTREGTYACPVRTAENGVVRMDMATVRAADGHVTVTFDLLPQRYHDLTLEVDARYPRGGSIRYAMPVAEPGDGHPVEACTVTTVYATLPQMGVVYKPER